MRRGRWGVERTCSCVIGSGRLCQVIYSLSGLKWRRMLVSNNTGQVGGAAFELYGSSGILLVSLCLHMFCLSGLEGRGKQNDWRRFYALRNYELTADAASTTAAALRPPVHPTAG